MVDSVRLEILETIINRLKYYLPESFLVSKDFNEIVESTGENSLLCKLDSSQVKTTLIDNTSYELETSITVEGVFKSDDNPDVDFEKAKSDRVQLVVDALTEWKYMTDSDANFGTLEIQGVNLTDTNNKEWETVSGLYIGYSVKFAVKHSSYR